jgi:toxin-antitoxin system PIN domain toxin
MSTVFLLDVNVLIAAFWPTHQAHDRVQHWLARHAREGWATCPLTESAFVRIISNPGFSPNALTVADALDLLRANLAHASHCFWENDIPFLRSIEPFEERLLGHQQISDAYLLGLVIHKRGKLATLDRAISSLLPEKSPNREGIVVI